MGDWMPEDGQSTMTATVDGLTNGMDYTFYVRAGNDAGYGEPGMDTETPMAPLADLVVTVSAAPMEIREGQTSTITATANREVVASDGAVIVNLTVVPPAGATLSENSITIMAGEDSGTVTLTAAEDDDHEAETVTVVATGTGIDGSQQIPIARDRHGAARGSDGDGDCHSRYDRGGRHVDDHRDGEPGGHGKRRCGYRQSGCSPPKTPPRSARHSNHHHGGRGFGNGYADSRGRRRLRG